MSFSDMFKTNIVTKVILIVLNLGLFALWRPEEQKIPLAWLILGLLLLLGALVLSFRQGMSYGHEACRLRATLGNADKSADPSVEAKVAKSAFSVNRGIKAVLAVSLPSYIIGCAYIICSLLNVENLVMPLRLISWGLAAPFWPCMLPFSQTFDRLTGWVAAVLMISPFILPLATFVGYMQRPKLSARSEKAMAEGKRRAKAKSRVVRRQRVPRAQKPEI